VEDDEIRTLVTRLARPDRSGGGTIVERAAILAEGADFTAVMAWIVAHGGKPETMAPTSTRHGLHGDRLDHGGGAAARTPLRFVLPADALV
jgi:hypothetical protein